MLPVHWIWRVAGAFRTTNSRTKTLPWRWGSVTPQTSGAHFIAARARRPARSGPI